MIIFVTEKSLLTTIAMPFLADTKTLLLRKNGVEQQKISFLAYVIL